MAQYGLSQRKLAMLAKVNHSYVSSWMLGQIPSPEVIVRIAAALKESPVQWLRFAGYDQLADLAAPQEDFQEITVLGGILAGAGEPDREPVVTTVPAAFSRDADFFLKIQGKSMEPDYPHGALVAVKKTDRILNEHPVVVEIDGASMVKIWHDTPVGPVLRSLNQHFPDIPLGDHLVIGVPIRLMFVRDL